jgi:hypothetical protein
MTGQQHVTMVRETIVGALEHQPGRIWPHKLKWNGEFAPAVEMSRILYANVPVPIPTEWGFVLVPLSRAGDGTGPAEAQPEGEDPGRSEK